MKKTSIHRPRNPPGFSARSAALAISLFAFAAGGCRTQNWDTMRRADSESYRHNLQAETKAILSAFPDGLALTNCVAIAKERSIKLASSQIAEKIATLDRKAAFSAFLPQVRLSYETLSLSKLPETTFDGTDVQLQDQNLHKGSVQILQPLFTPGEWLMYRSAKRGQEIATLVRERTGQMIELSVVNGFGQCCALDEEAAAREQDVAAARQLLRQTESLRAAGAATGSDVDRARATALEHERECANARREAKLARAQLLQVMNLWPLADVPLKPESLLDAAARHLTVRTPGETPRDLGTRDLLAIPVETWMFHALLSRPEMHAKDRTIALRRNEVIRSLVMFLPNLTGFANYYTTSDSYTVNQEYWGTGLQASLSAFTGFRDVAAYLKAREQKKSAYVEREETAMMILVQVLEAYKNLQNAQQALAVAEASATAEERATAEVESQHRAGQVELSRLLASQAARSETRARRQSAAFAKAVSLYAFLNVLGGHIEETPNPAAKP